MNRFPHVLAAVEKREQSIWAVADALIQDCGPPVRRRTGHNGSEAKLKACADELKRLGHREYNKSYLQHLRSTADQFPRNRRHAELSFFVHEEAGDPDFLDWVIEERGTDISGRDVRALRIRWRTVRRQRATEMHREAQRRVQQAPTEAARERAQRRADELSVMPAPSGRPSRREQSQMARNAELMEIDATIETARNNLRDALPRLRALPEIHAAFEDSIVENCEAIVSTAQQTINFIRQHRLTVIAGGRTSA